MTEPLILLEGVEKAYRFFRLTNLGMRLDAGQIMGLVGPNGAGKSTTLRIVMAMVRQDRGSVRVLGRSLPHEQAAAKRDVGFVSEDMRLHGSASLAWHMRLVADLCPDWDAAYASTLVGRFNLHPEQKAGALSHGERVKAALLLALARRPRLLILDEPTTGLDPVARREVLSELLDVVQDERRAVLFSSHNTNDVEQISDHITFIDRGEVVEAGDKETFLDRWRRLRLDVPPGVTLPSTPGLVETLTSGRQAIVTTRAYVEGLESRYTAAGIGIHAVERLTLEEIFVATVMHGRRERTS
jgi:ABC-2 type transport system ATP-binding protein